VSFSRESLLRKLSGLAGLAGTPGRLVIAYSGGLDSAVLLHALVASRDELSARLLAVHVDHGLQPESKEWCKACERRAADLGVEFVSLQVAVDDSAGQGLEAAARAARYGALRSLVQSADWLLSAHHKDDQAETLLLNLLRGSGPAGLAGIGEVQPFGPGWLVRPLLAWSRDELLAYARANDLPWIDDPSNEDRSFDRNFLRHEILPMLESRWPDASGRLRQSALLAGEAASMLDQLADMDRQALGNRPDRLTLEGLRNLPEERQRNLLRYVVRELGLPAPPATALRSVVADLLPAAEDAQPLVCWSGAEVRRYRDQVYILAEAPRKGRRADVRCGPEGIELGAGLGRLRLASGAEEGLSDAVIEAGLEIGFREGGEEIKLKGHRHTKKLKKLLQEAGVLPWMRDRLPLLYAAGELVAVADLWIAEAASSSPGTAIHWENRPALH
jgi:tRNA(Ile)-lysidine synthase